MSDKTATILNIKTDKQLKAQAQQVARDLGLPLGTVINSWLKNFVRDRTVTFSAQEYQPSEYLDAILREAHENKDNPDYWTSHDSVDDLMKDLQS